MNQESSVISNHDNEDSFELSLQLCDVGLFLLGMPTMPNMGMPNMAMPGAGRGMGMPGMPTMPRPMWAQTDSQQEWDHWVSVLCERRSTMITMIIQCVMVMWIMFTQRLKKEQLRIVCMWFCFRTLFMEFRCCIGKKPVCFISDHEWCSWDFVLESAWWWEWSAHQSQTWP